MIDVSLVRILPFASLLKTNAMKTKALNTRKQVFLNLNLRDGDADWLQQGSESGKVTDNCIQPPGKFTQLSRQWASKHNLSIPCLTRALEDYWLRRVRLSFHICVVSSVLREWLDNNQRHACLQNPERVWSPSFAWFNAKRKGLSTRTMFLQQHEATVVSFTGRGKSPSKEISKTQLPNFITTTFPFNAERWQFGNSAGEKKKSHRVAFPPPFFLMFSYYRTRFFTYIYLFMQLIQCNKVRTKMPHAQNFCLSN